MELNAGYRSTEIGVFPSDWDIESFGRLFTFSNGVNADKEAYGKGLRFVNVLETITHSHLYGPEISGRVSLPQFVAAAYAVKRGDVLFNRTSETDSDLGLAATFLGTEHVVFGGFVIRARPNGNRLDEVYSGYGLRAPAIRAQIIRAGQGAIRTNIGQESLRCVLAPIPPIHEQRAIAAALSDVDALLDGLDRLIAKKRDLKQAAMQQLLTGRTRLQGFRGEWKVKRLGDVADIDPENLSVNTNAHFTFNYIALEDVQRGVLRSHSEQVFAKAPSRARRKLRFDDILVSTVRPNLQSHLLFRGVTDDWVCSTGFCVVRCRKAVADPGFVLEQLFADGVTRQIDALLTGSNYPAINSSDVQALMIPLPSFDEQVAISAVLSDTDAEIAALEARRDKTRDLKQAMMQELLTGRTRLIEPAVQVSTAAPAQKGGRQANVHFTRSVLAAEIIDRMHEHSTFGHVKLEKIMFLVEHQCGVDTGSTYYRKAAGPYDNRALRSIDSQLRKQQWFDARKEGGRYRYVPMKNRGGHKRYFDRYFSGIHETFEKIVKTFMKLETERCEIVATLLAAWTDLLREKRDVSDAVIVHEVLNNWHESKQRIAEDRWLKALGWMRTQGLVPKGVHPNA